MKVTTNFEPLMDSTSAAFYDAAAQVRDLAIANARATKSHGRGTPLAAVIKMWRRQRKDRPTATIGSRKSEHFTANEFGAFPHAGRHARGPHIQRANAPKPVYRALQHFPEVYQATLKSGSQRLAVESFMTGSHGGPFVEAEGHLIGRAVGFLG